MINPFTGFPGCQDYYDNRELVEWREKWEPIILRDREQLEAVRCFVLGRRGDIEGDIKDFGELKPVLTYFLESEKVKS